MRAIKFRAWDTIRKKMFAAITALHLDDGVHSCTFISNYGDETTISMEYLELMQFTGLHDKNGKEIYEGDIVDCVVGEEFGNCPVVFNEGCFSLSIKNGINKNHDYEPCLYEADSRFIEVIGNIYENPEALK